MFDNITADNFEHRNLPYGMVLTIFFDFWGLDLSEEPFIAPHREPSIRAFLAICWVISLNLLKMFLLEKKKMFLSLNHSTLLLHLFLRLIFISLFLPPLISSTYLINNFVMTSIPRPPILQHHNDLWSYISHRFSVTLVMRFHLHPNTFIPFLPLILHFHHMTHGLLLLLTIHHK